MRQQLDTVIREVAPPVVWRGLRAMASSLGLTGGRGAPEEGGEKGPSWYDESFDRAEHWRRHYSRSRYYFLWTVIADRIRRAGVESILEIGCGPGQLACLLRDRGITRYHGFDFSPKRIEQARRVCPELTFSVQDAFETDLFSEFDYQGAVCTEFLEHVEQDLDVLKRIRSGTRFLGTVPNFPFTSHVRHFADVDEVRRRYGSSFRDLGVDAFLADEKGKTFFLLEGRVA